MDDLHDTGLSVERTTLAWQRTYWAMLVLIAIVLRSAFTHEHRLVPVALLAVLLVCIGLAISCATARKPGSTTTELFVALTSSAVALTSATALAVSAQQ